MDQVTLFSASEFGRTLTFNGRGTDHAWAGHNFLVGGGVRGGRIFGTYPSSLTGYDDTLTRGRIIPTLPWESVWYGLAQWFGVEEGAQMDYVLPNLKNFGSGQRLSASQLFE